MTRAQKRTASTPPRVSVVTPTKNRLALLCEAIESVQAQNFTEWEHIIVDDGSDDGTAEEVERRAKADSRIRFIRRSGDAVGANVCRNIGVRKSRGAYVLFLDSDDLLEPHCLARRVAILDRNEDVDFITFQTGFFIEELADQRQCEPDLLGDDLTRFLFFETPWIITGPTWRRSSLLRVGLFDESLLSWQDIELHVRALTKGVRYLRFPEVDHHVRWQNKVGRISADQRKSPRHLEAAIANLEKLERLVRDGPGMNWIRQRALCSLYFFVADCWAEAGRAPEALKAWGETRNRSIGTPFLYASGAVLLALKAWGVPCDRLMNKWKGWMRLRTQPELVRQDRLRAGEEKLAALGGAPVGRPDEPAIGQHDGSE